MPGFQAAVTQKRKQIRGCCLQYLFINWNSSFTHNCKCSCRSAYIPRIVYICQTRCNMSLCNNLMHFMCIQTIGIPRNGWRETMRSLVKNTD
jgi:hypothetical protein